MIEGAERGTPVSRDEYKARAPAVRESLLEAQRALGEAQAFPVIVVLAGVDTAGRGTTGNLLNEWMDPRWIVTRAWGAPSDEERERPRSGATGARCRRGAGSVCFTAPGTSRR